MTRWWSSSGADRARCPKNLNRNDLTFSETGKQPVMLLTVSFVVCLMLKIRQLCRPWGKNSDWITRFVLHWFVLFVIYNQHQTHVRNVNTSHRHLLEYRRRLRIHVACLPATVRCKHSPVTRRICPASARRDRAFYHRRMHLCRRHHYCICNRWYTHSTGVSKSL